MVDTQRVTPRQPVVITLPEQIDIANARQVAAQLAAALAPGVTVVIADMTATTFCDTMGIRTLVHAHQQAASSAELRLLITSAAVLRVMGILKVDEVLRIYHSLDAALAGQPPGHDQEIPAPG